MLLAKSVFKNVIFHRRATSFILSEKLDMGDTFSRLFRTGSTPARAVNRNTYYESHPGLRSARTSGVESEITHRTKPLREATDKELIQVSELHLDVGVNTIAHHTKEFDITDPLVYKKVTGKEEHREDLVVRRGQQFCISVEFNRAYDPKKDNLRLVFQFGKRPLASSGTDIKILPSNQGIPKEEWGSLIKSNNENTLSLAVMTPPTCAVGKWSLMIEVVKGVDKDIVVYRHQHPSPIYILFNPWCEGDPVYMSEKKLLDEYVLNETGKIYVGSHYRFSFKPWSFGQFEGDVLDCVMHLLETSGLLDKSRGNPVLVARKMSKMVNSSDEGGVLVGNWTGDYEGGTSPSNWTGSVDILNNYFKTKKSVQFGQCWVFSGVLTTVCRALGIPARSVTNFQSAHDTDGSITIDKHFDEDGNPLEYLNNDSVWNFHVWNDVWMARPELPPGYGGWQALDSTPQETSDGVYQTGPASVLAIKRGDVSLSYDAPFIFAEVNADYVYWKREADGSMSVTDVKEEGVGRHISTKRAFGRASWRERMVNKDPDREDLTDQYRFKEGSEEERVAVRRANQHAKRKYVYETKEKDVLFELHADQVAMGDTVKIGLKVKNTSASARTIHGSITLNSSYYTGVTYQLVRRKGIDYTILEPNEERYVDVEVVVFDYLDKLTDHCFLTMSCMCIVDETKQTFAKIDEIRLYKPHLTIKAPDNATVDEQFEVEVFFVNPLPVTLTKCELRVDGPGLQIPTRYGQPNVDTKQTFAGKFKMTPIKPGEREIIVYFNCVQISSVNNSHPITVSAK